MIKRAFRILLFFLTVCMGVDAQGYYNSGGQGTKLEYVRKKVKDGSIEWRHTMTVSEVKKLDNTTVITMRSSFFKDNGKPLYKTDIIEKMSVDKEGNYTADMETAMVTYIKARAGLNATATSTVTAFPADIQPGDTLPEMTGQAKVGFLTYTYRLWERKALRRETISVPAGTFDCIVMHEHKLEYGPGHKRDVVNITWYSKGIGFIRHDTYIEGELDTSEILHSIN